MRLSTLSVAGIGAAALVLGALTTGAATASVSGSSHSSLRASGVAGVHGAAKATALPRGINAGGKCGTSFGSELPTPDGLIAWNDTSGSSFDTAGAADVVCKGKAKKRKIKEVNVYGYFGTPTENFNVTFYANDPANGTDEANDAKVLCSYTNLSGTAGGQYPTHQLTTLTLDKVCKLPKGQVWVAVQNNDAAGPWYWEMQQELGGNTRADWVDRHDAFGSGCTTLDNDRYLIDCLGYDYNDFMLLLK